MFVFNLRRSWIGTLAIALALTAISWGTASTFGQSKDAKESADAASDNATDKSSNDDAADSDKDEPEADTEKDADKDTDKKSPRNRKKSKADEPAEVDNSPARPQYWATRTMEMRFGLTFDAGDNYCTDLHATVPFPMTWEEQEVELLGFDMPAFASYKMRPQKYGAGEIVIDMTKMSPKDVFDVVGTIRIKKSFVKLPEDTSILKIPENVQRNRELSNYMGDSPYIETKTRQIRQIAKEIRDAGHENAWQHVEAIYKYVREKIEYKPGEIRSSTDALKDGSGDCEELTSAFIAICRASNIPARCVWVPSHCYPEFYLEVDKDHGYWYPCQVAGDYQFGQMNEYRPILQKGDRFKTPESKKEVRYLAETFTCKLRSTGPLQPAARQIQDMGPLSKELEGLKDGAQQSASTSTAQPAAAPTPTPETKPDKKESKRKSKTPTVKPDADSDTDSKSNTDSESEQ